MRISDPYRIAMAGVSRTRRRRTASGVVEVTGVGAADEVAVSDRSLEVQRARSFALTAPEVRDDRVRELSREIEEGRYHVEGMEVARRMIREHLEFGR